MNMLTTPQSPKPSSMLASSKYPTNCIQSGSSMLNSTISSSLSTKSSSVTTNTTSSSVSSSSCSPSSTTQEPQKTTPDPLKTPQNHTKTMEETHNNHIKFPEKPPSISNINSNQQNGKDTKDAKNYDFNPQISMEEYKYTPEFDVEDCTVPIKNPFEDNSSESSHESQNSQDSIEDGSKVVSSKTPTSTLKRELDKERPVSSCKSWYSQYSQGKNKGVLNFFLQKSNS